MKFELHGRRQLAHNARFNPGRLVARVLFPMSVAASLILAPGMANADPTAADRTLARSLFDEGKELMAAGDFESACPKLAESQRLDPGGGTLLNLALCHEKQGKIASAYVEFGEARAAAAHDQNQTREQASNEHIAALKPRVSYVTVTVAGKQDGVGVKFDGNPISQAAFGARMAADPGEHTIEASAPGKKTWTKKVTVRDNADKVVVQVPLLEVLPVAVAVVAPPAVPTVATPASKPQPPKPEPAKQSKPAPIAAYIVGGAGIVVLGVGAGFGFASRSKWQDAQTQNSQSMVSTARTYARVADVGIGVGLAGIVVGTVLLFTQGSSEKPKQALHLVPVVGTNGGGFEFGGAW